ncbi:MAG: trehalose-6-phosphate synthase [Actinobacteria bacterium]|nr:trehalose-6-phosphate synthase [Actinomycetota bacterium]
MEAPPDPTDRLGRPILVASNRGPVSFHLDERGQVTGTRGAGGLVTALTGVLQRAGGLWIAAAMSDGDRLQASRGPGGRIEARIEGSTYRLRYLDIAPDRFDRYYNVISNRILWFCHHYLWDAPRSPRFSEATAAAWEDYVAVNDAFARALAREGTGGPGAPAHLVQDYHLALVPRLLRERRRTALIAHFTHTPWADPGYFRILPRAMRTEILRGMLGADVLGFHDDRWAERFLLSCRELPEARIDLEAGTVETGGRSVHVGVYPIAIDADALLARASRPDVRAIRRELQRERGDGRLVVRVDRMELSKNVLRGFLAFEAYVRRSVRRRGRVRFLALLNPSRREIPEYRAYTRECIRVADRINEEMGEDGWTPIEMVIGDDFPRAVAAYSEYDALVVNPVIDGMNLVAMEGPVLNRRNGVLILSEGAGAHSILGDHAISVNPFDVAETADALERALSMPEAERRSRASALRRTIRSRTPEAWIRAQLADLEAAGRARRAG